MDVFQCNFLSYNQAWPSMNSQIKEALSEFINNNSSAIDKAMENASRDLAKGAHTNTDLVNYLTCPTPQLKEGQPMVLDEKSSIHSSAFNQSEMASSHQPQFSPLETTQFSSEPGYSAGTMNSASHSNSNQHQQQFLQRHDSFGQNTSLFSDPRGVASNSDNTFVTAATVTAVTFSNANGHQNGIQTSSADSQYYQSGQTEHFPGIVSSNSDKQFQPTLQTPFSNSENSVTHFQGQSQSNAKSFQDSSAVLSTAFSSNGTSQLSYSSGDANLGFGMMEINQTSLNNLDNNAGQFKVTPEKMSVDEPEAAYPQTNIKASTSQYQQDYQPHSAAGDGTSSGTLLQVYSSETFHQHSAPLPASTAASYTLSDTHFPQSSESESHGSNEFTTVVTTTSTVLSPPSFDLVRSPYTSSSLSSPFNSQTFQHNAAIIPQPPSQAPGGSDYHVQASPGQACVTTADGSLQSGTGMFSVPSSPCPSHPAFASGQPSPYQSGQYQGSPAVSLNHLSSGLPDHCQNSSPPASALGFEQHHLHNGLDGGSHYHQSPNSNHASPAECTPFQASSALGTNYNADANIIQSPDSSVSSYLSSSSTNNGVPFSPSAPAGSVHHQETYSAQQSASNTSDATSFRTYNGQELSLHTSEMNVTASCGQTFSNYGVTASTSQGTELNDLAKASADPLIGNFPTVTSLPSSTHTGFSDDSDSFSQLELEAVVNSFSDDAGVSTMSHSSISMRSSQSVTVAGYTEYQYSNITPAAVTFQGTSSSGTDMNSDTARVLQYDFSQQSGLSTGGAESFTSSVPVSAVPNTTGQSDSHQFSSSSFDSMPTTHVSSESFPQPMQVQDSDYSHKLQEPASSFSYQNPVASDSIASSTETAMDISTGLGDKNDNLASGISYEEIHMSIVKAGDALSKANVESKQRVQHPAYATSLSQSSDMDITSSVASLSHSVFADQASGFFQVEKTVTYNSPSQSQTMDISNTPGIEQVAMDIGMSGKSRVLQQQPTELNDSSSYTASTQESLSNMNEDHNIISGLLNTLESSSSAPGSKLSLQNQVSTQNTMAVPNFLDSPGTVVSFIGSSTVDNADPVPSAALGPVVTQYIVTMVAASSTNSRPVLSSCSMSQPTVAIMSNANVAGSLVTMATNTPTNPQMMNSVVGMSLSSSPLSSFLGQSGQSAINLAQVSNMDSSLSQVLLESSEFSANQNVNSPEVFMQTVETNSSGVQDMSALKTKPAADVPQTSSGVTGVTTVLIPSGSSNMSANQSHIIMSLEDLQKLLAQHNLSAPTQAQTQQEQQWQQPTTSASPTLILQKPPQSLRQAQPKLFIRGGPIPPRLMQPQQQLQQTREKLQLLVHQPHQPQPFPTLVSSQKIQEHTGTSQAKEIPHKVPTTFQLFTIPRDQQTQQAQQKLQLLQQAHTMDKQQPKLHLQLKQTPILQQQQPVQNLLLQQQVSKGSDLKTPTLQLGVQQHLILNPGQAPVDLKPTFGPVEPQQQQQQQQHQQAQNVIQLAQMKHELQLLQKQHEQEKEQQQLDEKPERQCSESLKKDYKHLHSLLTGPTAASANTNSPLGKIALPLLNFTSSVPTQTNLPLSNRMSLSASSNLPWTQTSSSAPFSLGSTTSLPVANSSLSLGTSNTMFSSVANNCLTLAVSSSSSGSQVSVTPLTTLTFTKTFTPSVFSKPLEVKDMKTEMSSTNASLATQTASKPEGISSEKTELDGNSDPSLNRQASLLAQILTERKRSHTPLSVDLGSPTNSNSEAPSPVLSPNPFEDGNTQLTLIERSADLNIKSDTMQSMDDDEENASFFDLNAIHKRPSSYESHSKEAKSESVPMKILKPSLDADAHSSVPTPAPLEQTFDFSAAVSSAGSNFSFAFANKEDNTSEVFTFGSNSLATATSETLPINNKPMAKTTAMKAIVPTQPVKPTSRRQKEYSLKAYYSSKLDAMELKILEQPEAQHRARYQTEGSRGAIKDVNQQGFPIVKLFGYNKPSKLQVFIGDECGRVKPHGFYQACRVFGKNSTVCVEQEIEGTAVIEIEMLPEQDMTVKLDCIGILKLRNADVERRIGPKRARDKKKNNTRARLVMRCLVDRPDGTQHILQVVSNPIVCTQPVGQPEISRMSLCESSVEGGDHLFIIGKNFKNKGTSVLFQKLDANDEAVVWQAEAEIEQEYFQPTHLICKVPAYKDRSVEKPQVAQIVVSCAGKKSDPQRFTYKPVYPVAPSVKLEVPMETDVTAASQPLTIVSPEALHLNHLVHQTHIESSSNSSSSLFQLPPGTVPTIQDSSLRSPPIPASSHIVKPAKLFSLSNSQMSTGPVTSATVPVSTASSSSQQLTPAAQSAPSLPTFLLDERPDGLVQKSHTDSAQPNSSPRASGDRTTVSCVVHSHSETNPISGMSYSISGNHPQPSLTPSASSGLSTHTPNISNQHQSPTPAPITSKPLFLVVDSSALQSHVGGDKLQQLLQQLLEAQSKVGL